MNQINLDALLQIGSGRPQPNLQSLKLTPDTLYQALLNIGADGVGQLHVATPQGPVQIQLTPQQTALLQQAVSQSPATLQNQLMANQALATQVTLSSQLPGQFSGSLSAEPSKQLTGQLTGQPTAQLPDKLLGQQLPEGSQQSPAANKPLQLQLQLQPGSQGQLLVQTQQAPVQIPLQPSQLLQLLGSQQQQPLTMLVQLQRQQQQLILTLPNQQQVQLPASWLEGAADWPEQQPKTAQLTVQLVQGQIKISVTLQDTPTERAQQNVAPEKQTTARLNATMPFNSSAPDKPSTSPAIVQNALASQSHKAQVLTVAQTTALLPVLAKALQPANVSLDGGQLQLGKLELPYSSTKATVPPHWQLQAMPAAGKAPSWQLQLSVDTTSTVQLKVENTALNRPIQWQQPQAQTPLTMQQPPKVTVDISNAWRQWLPLQIPTVDPLLELPELPPAVLAILKELKAQTLDTSRPIQQTQLQQQLTAALQFNPLQQLNQIPSSASTLAVALQLLLGRLGNQPVTEVKSSPAQRLQNLVAQLDQTQSSQLLKQLAGHASKMQGAQFATAEQAQTPQQHQQLFIQLPLVQQGESRFAEMALTEREADGKAGEVKRQQWQLTMKFDLADAGHLLVQVRLTGLEVSLQFYAEQATVVSSAEQFLPLLKDRLKMQGLEVTEAQCQLGKIPEQLFARSNSLLAVRV